MNKIQLEKLEKKLEYCIREELYEKAVDIQAQIKELRKAKPISNLKVTASSLKLRRAKKRFVDFLNEQESNRP